VATFFRSKERFYHSELIGNLIPDLIVDDAVIVEPKVAVCFTDTHVAQMLGYLNITGLNLALPLNFKNARLEWKRVLRPREAGEDDAPDLNARAFIRAIRLIRDSFETLKIVQSLAPKE
jgi:hypothetical protein